jgi:hypothetical protein
MNWTTITHLGYLLIAVPLTIWVAHTLSRHGRVFLEDVFPGKEALAESVDKLLVLGFYLLNVGFVLLYLRRGDPATSLTGLLEALSGKIGIVLVVLGVVHFINVYVFNAVRRRSRLEELRKAPVMPQGWLPPSPAQSSPIQSGH